MGKEEGGKFKLTNRFMEKYFGRSVEVTIKDGRVVRGKVAWYSEPEEYEDELEFGLALDDIEIDGKKQSYGMSIPESYVVSFAPLEGENTESIFKDA